MCRIRHSWCSVEKCYPISSIYDTFWKCVAILCHIFIYRCTYQVYQKTCDFSVFAMRKKCLMSNAVNVLFIVIMIWPHYIFNTHTIWRWQIYRSGKSQSQIKQVQQLKLNQYGVLDCNLFSSLQVQRITKASFK